MSKPTTRTFYFPFNLAAIEESDADELARQKAWENRKRPVRREPGVCVECGRLSDFPTCHACTDEHNREQAS